MKHPSPLLVFSFYFLVLASACTKQIEFSGDETDPMPVMVSYAGADSTLRVRMTLSRFFLGRDTVRTVDNASFRVELNGSTPASVFSYDGRGMYGSTLALGEGDTLTLTASVPGYGEVKAGCRLPARPNVTDFVIVTDDFYGDSLYVYGEMGFQFTLDDRPGHDYYLVRAFMVKDSTGKKIPLMVSVDDDVIYEDAMSEDVIDIGTSVDLSYGANVIFTDNNINGRRHTVKGTVMVSGYDYYGDTNLRVWMEVCSVSRDTYLYLATVKAQSVTDDEMGFLSEPVQIHTNVVGGIGILGAMTPVRFPLFPLVSEASSHANTHNR